ncbi:FliH/SctL family protein [Anaerocolumna sp.]|uniref:FliH/SctL family protein n=1 Tax=Anaerocolumna sp. TaxID=2041569 RepID=UPI0028B2655B|nr:FliH/SctL family protein [Anaerocolumna sp.]
MSNIIKSQFVYIHQNEKKVIDTNQLCEKIFLNRFTAEPDEYEVQDELAATEDSFFKEGIKATVVETRITEEEEKFANQQREDIIAGARQEAADIIAAAEEEAKKMRDSLYEEACQKGYKEGFEKGKAAVEDSKKELDILIQKQKEDYQKQIETLEPEFVKLMCGYIEKITGIIVEDKEEIILHLIHNALIHGDRSKNYSVKTSKDDYDLVLSKKEEIYDCVGEDAVIEIIMDNELSKNQCFIETDNRVIQCSLDVELNSLIEDLKILSHC